MLRRGQRGSAADDGMVSAETAAALPVLVIVLGMLLWGLAVGVMQARCVAAARGAALATARGEDERSVTGAVRSALGERSRVTVRRAGDEILVVVTGRVGGLRWLPARTVSATAYAAAEPEAVP